MLLLELYKGVMEIEFGEELLILKLLIDLTNQVLMEVVKFLL
jgi:hypothetical protein